MKNFNIIPPTLEDMVTAFSKADSIHRIESFNALRGADVQTSLTNDKLLTLAETKQMLKVSAATVNRYVKSGILKKIQIGGKHSKNLFRLSQIQALIESSRIPNSTTQEVIV